MLLLAALYFASGYVGLMLAIPPGYATALWPPSGIALAFVMMCGYRISLGVLLGSFLLNFSIYYNPSDLSNITSISINACLIAIASTLQVLFAAFLLKIFMKQESTLDNVKDILALILVGGLVGSLVSSTLSVAVLAIRGFVDWGDFHFSWFNWWAGDAIGIMIFTPLTLILCKPKSEISVKRKIYSSLSVGTVFVIFVLIYFLSNKVEGERFGNVFNVESTSAFDKISIKISSYESIISAIRQFYAASKYVDRKEFGEFVKTYKNDYSSIRSIMWVPRVKNSEVSEYVDVAKPYVPNFRISEINSYGYFSPVSKANQYFPIYYLETNSEMEGLLGFNLSSDGNLKRLIAESISSGKLVSSEVMDIDYGANELNGFFLLQPIYKKTKQLDSAEDREKYFEGFVTLALDLNVFLESSIGLKINDNIYFKVIDKSSGEDNVIYNYDKRSEVAKQKSNNNSREYINEKYLDVGHRKWLFLFSQNEVISADKVFNTSWLVLSAGLLFTGLFGVLILLITGRSDYVQSEINQKVKELSKNKNLLELYIKSIPLSVAIFDKEMNYVALSDKWADLFDLSKDVIGVSHYQVLPYAKEKYSHWIADYDRALSGEIIKKERDKYGDQWIRYELHPWYDDDKKIGGIVVFTEEVTEKVEMEDMLKESESQFRSAMEHSSIGMALVSPDGRWLKANKAVCDILKYSEEELIQTDFQTLTHPDDLDKDLGQVLAILDKKIDSYQMEKRYIRKDGEEIWALLTVALVLNKDGNPKHFISQIQDITKRKRYEQKLEESNEDLERFAYVCSHDLKEPIRTISSFTSLLYKELSEEVKGQERIAKFLGFIMSSSIKAQDLINDLLEFSRITREEHDLQPIDLNSVLLDVKANIADLIKSKDAKVSIPKNLPTIKASETQMIQLFQNLISNGIKYSREDIAPKVTIKYSESDKYHIFSVEDNGIGIEEKYFNKIFEIFQRLERDDSVSGTGVGLAIVKKIIFRYGGNIEIESKIGKGTKFIFTIAKEIKI